MRFGCGVMAKFKWAKFDRLKFESTRLNLIPLGLRQNGLGGACYDLLFRSACVLEGVFNRERLPPFAYACRFVRVAAESVGAWIFDIVG